MFVHLATEETTGVTATVLLDNLHIWRLESERSFQLQAEAQILEGDIY